MGACAARWTQKLAATEAHWPHAGNKKTGSPLRVSRFVDSVGILEDQLRCGNGGTGGEPSKGMFGLFGSSGNKGRTGMNGRSYDVVSSKIVN